LARTGRTKYPTYRIVAAESARAATGKFIEVLGHYNPHTKELVINHEAVAKRLSHGAQPSNTVVKLFTRDKVELPAWVKLKTKAPKVTEAPAEEAPAAEDATEVTEAEAAAEAEPGDEARVAEVAEAEATAVEDNTPNINDTETAND
jgi:small subunit ribosomal protein S16